MTQVGNRFELAGRAAAAQRYSLAEFEVDELAELFESDVPAARLPKEGPTAHISPMTTAFRAQAPKELLRAIASKNQAEIALAFEHTAILCNACHAASLRDFIQISPTPGHAVPDLDPVGGEHANGEAAR